MDLDGMEALRLFRDSRLCAIESDGRGWISRRLRIGDLAGQHDASLNRLGKNCLAGLRVLIPAVCLARKKRITKPLEGNKSMSSALSLSQSGAQLLHAGLEIGRDDRFLPVIVILVIMLIDDARGASDARGRFSLANALKVDADFVFLGRPCFR